MIITGNPDRAMTVREWDPVLQLKGYTLIGIWTHPFNLEALRGGLSGPLPHRSRLCQLAKVASLPRG